MSLLILFNQPINWTQQNNESFVLSDNIPIKQVSTGFIDSLSLSEYASLGQFLQLSDILSFSDSFIKDIAINKNESLLFDDSYAKRIAKSLLDSISAIESFSGQDQHYQSISDFITIGETINVTLRYDRLFIENLNLSDSLLKSQKIKLSEALGLSEGLSNQARINMTDGISFSELFKDYIDSQIEIAINMLAKELNMTTDEVKLLRIFGSADKNFIIELLTNGLQ
jgi:hypothetical protein